MKKLYLLLLLSVVLGSCSRLLGPKKVACCEQTAACCYEHMCCLPRYAKAAGLEPKSFTPEVPVYGRPEDFEPEPGETITKPGLLSRFNPFGGSEDEHTQSATSAQDAGEKDDTGFFDRLLPF